MRAKALYAMAKRFERNYYLRRILKPVITILVIWAIMLLMGYAALEFIYAFQMAQ